MYEQYSVKQSPSIQKVGWRPDHLGLFMQGITIGDEGINYGAGLQVPQDTQLRSTYLRQHRNKPKSRSLMIHQARPQTASRQQEDIVGVSVNEVHSKMKYGLDVLLLTNSDN